MANEGNIKIEVDVVARGKDDDGPFYDIEIDVLPDKFSSAPDGFEDLQTTVDTIQRGDSNKEIVKRIKQKVIDFLEDEKSLYGVTLNNIRIDGYGDPDAGRDAYEWRNYWEPGVQYEIDDMVIFDNAVYQCQLAHLSDAAVEPDDPADTDPPIVPGGKAVYNTSKELTAGAWELIFDKMPRHRGGWQEGKTYRRADVVRRNKKQWICMDKHRNSNSNNRPPSNKWEVFLEDGPGGGRGPGGRDGKPGAKGNKGHTFKKDGWKSGEQYAIDDVVKFEKNVYICIQDIVEDSAPSLLEPDDPGADAYWDLLVPGPPTWQGQWKANPDTRGGKYRPGDVVWVNIKNSPDSKDRDWQYICLVKHNPSAASKPSPDTVDVPDTLQNQYWEFFNKGGDVAEDGAGFRFRSGPWPTEAPYLVNDVITYEGVLYVCIQEIPVGSNLLNMEPDYTPVSSDPQFGTFGATPNPWKKVTDATPKNANPFRWDANNPPNRYRVGQLVKLNKTIYFCMVKHARSSDRKPGTTGGSSFWLDYNADGADAAVLRFRGKWASNKAYAINDVVSFENATYICAVAHSASSVEPDDSIVQRDANDAIISTGNWDLAIDRPANWRGSWNNNTKYRKNDTVKIDREGNTPGMQWICLEKHVSGSNNKPNSGINFPRYWQQWGADGNDGTNYIYRGEWGVLPLYDTNFAVNDLVTHLNATYRCILAHQKTSTLNSLGEPDDDIVNWAEHIPRIATPVGDWNSTTRYRKGEVVRYDFGVNQNPRYGTFWCIDRLGPNGPYLAPPFQTNKWKRLTTDGPAGPTGLQGATGPMGPQGVIGSTGPIGNQGKPGAGFMVICDGKNDGSPIPFGARNFGAPMDGTWPHKFTSAGVGSSTSTVYMQAAVKMAKGTAIYKVCLCNKEGTSRLEVTGSFLSWESSAKDNTNGQNWDYSGTASISKANLDAYPYVAIFKVSKTTDEANIKGAKVAIWW